MQTKNVRDGGGAADYGHVSFVEIVEHGFGFFVFDAGLDGFGGEGSALDGYLSDAGHGLSIFICGVGQVADDEYVGIIGDGKVGGYFDAAAFVGFGVSALGQFSAEGSGLDSTGPEDGMRSEAFSFVTAAESDAVGADAGDHYAFHDFNAEFGDEFFGLGGKIFRERRQDARAAFY